jgi:hypothetical protein
VSGSSAAGRQETSGPARAGGSLRWLDRVRGLAIVCPDLLPVLERVPGGRPDQRHNLHWTAVAHRAVAAWLADTLAAGGWLGRP